MKTITALLCLMITTNAMADNKQQPQTEQATRPDLVLNQQRSIVSTELVLIRLKESVSGEQSTDAGTSLPPLVPPTTLLWSHPQLNPQVHHVSGSRVYHFASRAPSHFSVEWFFLQSQIASAA